MFGNIHTRKRKLSARLEGIQRAMSNSHSTNLIKLDKKLHKELNDVLEQEELLWFQ